jgi:hypothetical protein
MPTYKKRISDNAILKFADNESPAVVEDFSDPVSEEIEDYEIEILKTELTIQRQTYRAKTLDAYISSLEDPSGHALDGGVATKRQTALDEIDSIQAETTLEALELYDNPF